MATIGQSLTAPESGWRRYDDTDSRISFIGNWNNFTGKTSAYNGTYKSVASASLNDKVFFKFKGTKLRIISETDSNINNVCQNINIKIDGNIETYSQPYNGNIYQILNYEKSGLLDAIHIVEIYSSEGKYLYLDAIDIDNTGYLLHPILNQTQDINSMQVGDCIPCRYTASTSGNAGTFSELRTCIADEIPLAGTATPDGLFYFIKTDKGTLIADRVIQTGISWDALNSAKFIEGKYLFITLNNSISCITNNTTSSGIVLTNASILTGFEPWRAFDGNILKTTNWFNTGSGTTSAWLSYKFATQKKIVQYSLYCYDITRAPYSWTFEGSNDGTNWTVLDTQIGVTNWISNSPKLFNMNNLNSYLYYRINISAVNNSDRISITQLQMSESTLVNTSIILRNLTGGNSYLDANGNSSITDKSLGAWPPNNEWDTYLVKSTLNGKITAGDNNIWHYTNNIWNYCKETPINGVIWTSYTATNTYRSVRGGSSINSYAFASGSGNNIGFRPVLEYLESNSKATNLFY